MLVGFDSLDEADEWPRDTSKYSWRTNKHKGDEWMKLANAICFNCLYSGELHGRIT